jgi:hypothetical protein
MIADGPTVTDILEVDLMDPTIVLSRFRTSSLGSRG